ncbi:MAG: hypothetical protein AAGJ54_03750 [Planctomycetota bacterium]
MPEPSESTNGSPDAIDARLTRLEEATAFTDHDTRELAEGLAELLRRADELDRRLAKIEDRLELVERGTEELGLGDDE